MGEVVDIRLYTASQIKEWLFHNKEHEGLTGRLIDKTRAQALVANPYVTDDMALVSAIFVDKQVAAYTCVFPDLIQKPERKLIYWATTLYVNPKYEGRGFAYCVIAQIGELYGENYFDLDAADASVENFRYQGLCIDYVSQYLLHNKNIVREGIRGEYAYWKYKIEKYKKSNERALLKKIKSARYCLRYVSYIDDALYSFIQGHSDGDLFLRSQETFNWILKFPFMQESPLARRVKKECRFSSTRSEFRIYGVCVYCQEGLAGFVVLRCASEEWSVKYLYYDKNYENEVFLAIAEHLVARPKRCFFTASKPLHDFVCRFGIFTQDAVYKKSFAYPADFVYDKALAIQAGDGDNIT